MLTRNSQVGEFYVLQPPQVAPDVGKEKFTCDVLIYDEESDRHVRITWGQALKACCISAGNINDQILMSHKTDKMANAKLAAWYKNAEIIKAYNEGEEYLFATGGTKRKVVYADIDTDIRIVIARPFIEHLMHSVIMAVSGRDTGATLFGPADMQLSVS